MSVPAPAVITAPNGFRFLVSPPAAEADVPTVLRLCRGGGARPRTILYLDVYNLFKVAKVSYGRGPDFGRILRLLAGSPLPWLAKAFMPNNGRGRGLEAALRGLGYLVFSKAGREVAPGRLKANFDVEIALEAVGDLRLYRPVEVYLVSGDGDFAPLVGQLRAGGCRVTVAAFPAGFSEELKAAADRVVELGADQLLDRAPVTHSPELAHLLILQFPMLLPTSQAASSVAVSGDLLVPASPAGPGDDIGRGTGSRPD